MPAPIATLYFAGKEYSLGISPRSSSTYLGGPGYDEIIEGPRYGPRRLHHVLTIKNAEFAIPGYQFGFVTSFYYGICFEGCTMTYRRTASAAIRITDMHPRKSPKDYPYFGYPDLLPFHPLQVTETKDATTETVQESLSNTGWTVDPAKLYLAIPNSVGLGLSLWPPGEEVEMVFEYDPENGITRACNQAG